MNAKVTTIKRNPNQLQRLAEEINKINNPDTNKNFVDENEGFWKLEPDKQGNGYAVIRFLEAPAVDGEDGLPWVKYFDHGFKGPTGSWYIEKSLTTLNQKDPVSELNTILWNSGNESDKEIARKQKRRLHFVSLIKVIRDSKNPDNEGKVFKFKYGKKIFRKIEEMMSPGLDEDGNPIPGEEDKVPVNPFDFYEGCNFHLRLRKQDGFPNYDKSSFDPPSRIAKTDKEIEELWRSLPSLAEVIAPDKFKSYDVLKAKLNKVLGLDETGSSQVTAATTPVDSDGLPTWKSSIDTSVDDDDPLLKEFEDLANA